MGEGSAPDKEPVRFKSRVSAEFPASEIQEVYDPFDERHPLQMLVNFMGLTGALGPMPMPYTELILERVRKGDTALRDFLDIFNHRLVSIMYRVRKTYRIAFETIHPDRTRFASYLYSLFGLGTTGLKERMHVRDRALLLYAGLLAQQPRSMHGLEKVLSDYFKVRIRGKQLVGWWYRVEADQITRIGETGANRTLGESAFLGTRFWSRQGRFSLQLGPLSLDEYASFLPVGPAFEPLYELTRFYAGIDQEFHFRLALQGPQVPESRLGDKGPKGLYLGWTSFLKTRPYEKKIASIRLFPKLLGRYMQRKAL